MTMLSVHATPISEEETTRRCTIFLTNRSRRNFPFRVVWSVTPEARCLRIAVARSRALPGAIDFETIQLGRRVLEQPETTQKRVL